MLVATRAEYAKKYQHVRFHGEDGILQVMMHTNGSDLEWGFGPHQEMGYCFTDIGADLENKVIILTGSGDTSFTRGASAAARWMRQPGANTCCRTPSAC
jgi:enoyl-CoA hydratase/carnithine racemase